MPELRPYQQAARDAVHAEWDKGNRRTLVLLPTGTGKTVVFSKVAEDQVKKGGRVLVMAHRNELLEQAADKLKRFSALDCALEKGSSTSLGSMFPVTVGSVQSLCIPSRLARFPEDYFSDIIVDEAHHCLSPGYKRVLAHFPLSNVLGVTATPDRGDMKDLSEIFDSCAYEYRMTDAINDGYLCPVKARMIPLKLDISDVKQSAGDLSAADIGSVLDPYLESIASEMEKYCAGRKTVVFLPLVDTSQKFCALLRAHGIRAAEVNGESPDRSEILYDFEHGKYDVLCNAMLLTEGWDCPCVDCVVVLRPTKIRSLYQQMVGRGMRLFPGKEELLLLDFLWLTEKHDLCRPSSLICRDKKTAAIINRMIEDASEEISLSDAEEQANRNVLAEREAALAEKLSMMRRRSSKLVDPLQFFMSIEAEDLAGYTPTFAWEYKRPSKKQLEFLESQGIDSLSVKNMGLASQLIERIVRRRENGLSTPKQIRCLERFGFNHVGTWSFEKASEEISRLAKNNWRL